MNIPIRLHKTEKLLIFLLVESAAPRAVLNQKLKKKKYRENRSALRSPVSQMRRRNSGVIYLNFEISPPFFPFSSIQQFVPE